MLPIDYYHEQIRKGLIVKDQQQLAVLKHLQQVYFNLLKEHKSRSRFFAFLRKQKKVQGVYLWGGVGVGKTFMMDCFYHSVPFDKKMRMHFHQFMQFIHLELKHNQGEKNPLKLIAKQLARKTMLLCFDEFFVTDITDAMLLARLFKELIANKICLVITSNIIPDDLYKNGLQRDLFIPAISMLKEVTTVLHIPTIEDYRLRHLKKAGSFFTPNDEIADEDMEKCFLILSNQQQHNTNPIEIHSRPIQIKKQAGDVIWFDFDYICSVPRSQYDYLAIADQYSTVMISNIPKILPEDKNTILLFIRMIDIFYDARIRLICSSSESIENIYTEGLMLFEYARTRSRLLEMQSEGYFAKQV